MKLEVLLFSAKWCPPCRVLKPILEKIKVNMPDVEFKTIDVDEDPKTSQQMAVAAIPTLVFVRDGSVVETLVGLYKEQVIVDTINRWK